MSIACQRTTAAEMELKRFLLLGEITVCLGIFTGLEVLV